MLFKKFSLNISILWYVFKFDHCCVPVPGQMGQQGWHKLLRLKGKGRIKGDPKAIRDGQKFWEVSTEKINY